MFLMILLICSKKCMKMRIGSVRSNCSRLHFWSAYKIRSVMMTASTLQEFCKVKCCKTLIVLLKKEKIRRLLSKNQTLKRKSMILMCIRMLLNLKIITLRKSRKPMKSNNLKKIQRSHRLKRLKQQKQMNNLISLFKKRWKMKSIKNDEQVQNYQFLIDVN